MNIADELQKLQELHRTGALTDEEFATAKAAVLAAKTTGADAPLNETAREQLEEMKLENTVARLDREWQLARERYMIAGQYGNRYIPSRGVSVLMGVVVTGFGIFWIAMAMSITSNMPGIGGAFPCFGVIFILFGVGMSIYSFSKATQYEEEYQRYQQRRAELLAGRSEERS
jgi:Short C-terminal domain